jgi:hypothetical protein
MSLGDFSFIAAFVIFPLVIVALSVWALRTLDRREHRPLARFSTDSEISPAESTQELPIATGEESRDWAAAVQPTRGPAAEERVEPAAAATQAFKLPTYRGRSTGVVRRVSFQPRTPARQPGPTPLEESEPQ